MSTVEGHYPYDDNNNGNINGSVDASVFKSGKNGRNSSNSEENSEEEESPVILTVQLYKVGIETRRGGERGECFCYHTIRW